jgi:hypothetical protein
MDLYERNFMNNVTVDLDNHEELKKFICAVIIKLEDGSDEDLKVLEEKTVEINQEVEAKSEDKSGNVEENSDDENVDYDNIKSI